MKFDECRMNTLEAICWSAVATDPKLSNNVKFDTIGTSGVSNPQATLANRK